MERGSAFRISDTGNNAIKRSLMTEKQVHISQITQKTLSYSNTGKAQLTKRHLELKRLWLLNLKKSLTLQ